MKTTKQIHQLYEINNESEKDISEDVWYSLEELNKARLNGIRDLRDMIQSDLNKLFKKYTQDFADIHYDLMGDNDE